MTDRTEDRTEVRTEVRTEAQRIVVIDDDVSILSLVMEILEDTGCEVVGTADPVEGLQLVEDDPPDLVLLDMRMPVVDGWQFKDELIAREIDVPIVVMTAAQDARAWALEIGAISYIAKPFDIDDLLRIVRDALAATPGDTHLLRCSLEAEHETLEGSEPGRDTPMPAVMRSSHAVSAVVPAAAPAERRQQWLTRAIGWFRAWRSGVPRASAPLPGSPPVA